MPVKYLARKALLRMSTNPTPRNEALTLSLSAESDSSRLPVEDMAAVSHEPQGSNGKPRGKKAKTRGRKGKNGTVTLDSSVERESHGSPVDMAIVPYEPQGEGSKGNGTATSNPSAENGVSESLVDGMPIVPHDPEGTNGQIKCRKGKKRGRHFDREVRAKILQGSYLTKAERMAEIKAKQDEDKLAARLHSFSGDSVMSKGSKSSSEKTEMARSLKYISAPWKNKASKSEEHMPVVHPEVILCVEIYQKRYGSVKSQEFLVLGSQFLTDLRDNIYCLTDKLMKVAGQHDYSGYFLIDDTFYNDTRHCSASDYSKPILEWLNDSNDEVAEKWDAITSGVLKKRQKDLLRGLNISNVPEFKSERMQRTRFSDLHFRLGAGYLYCHQGNCKHMIVIRDMRLIHPEDTQNQAEYPLMTFQLQKRFQKCSVCQIYLATKMSVDDKWALNNPCYFCIKCYYLLHYKEDGSLLYPHTVYDYIQE
ncbi:snRNA-activating protein complex subunit-like isoform X2 [Phragmites australis]|uniref:snRNA-activating protein complex subunit-like isoform X2 n=1 Tax=Phragmites australis TaxID=29695 RepID=UPI002D785E18|nr:snRNA-activating protein complex subunit-like isoform X2 [Phragmites australis]XP_062207851.1 snRNA-activating protein complex subunit-like isoform X2 [Phragmites australis]